MKTQVQTTEKKRKKNPGSEEHREKIAPSVERRVRRGQRKPTRGDGAPCTACRKEQTLHKKITKQKQGTQTEESEANEK